MARIEDTIRCDNCGVEITWGPIVKHAYDYCCQDCMQGLPCGCGERMEQEDDRRAGASTPASIPGGVFSKRMRERRRAIRAVRQLGYDQTSHFSGPGV